MKAYNIELKNGRKWEIISGPFFDGLPFENKAQKELEELQNCWPKHEFRIKEARKIDEPAVQLAMVYDGGSIDYFGGHHLPQLVVTLYSTTTMGELWEELLNEFNLVGEMFDQYKDNELAKALAYFYQLHIKGRRSRVFAKFSREETRNMNEYGEGSAYVFVFGRLEMGGPFGHTYIAYP